MTTTTQLSEKLPPLTTDSLIVEAEDRIESEALRAFYRERGIKCFLCAAAEIETFNEGADIHHFDDGKLVAELNELARTHPWRAPDTRGPLSRFGAWLKDKLQDRGAAQRE